MKTFLSVFDHASLWLVPPVGPEDGIKNLAADMLLHPTFPKDELDRYKTRTKAGLIQQRSSAAFLAALQAELTELERAR